MTTLFSRLNDPEQREEALRELYTTHAAGKTIDVLDAALRAAWAREQEWQPIETAPQEDDFLAACWGPPDNGWTLLILCRDDDPKYPDFPWTTLEGNRYHEDAPKLWKHVEYPK